MREVKLEHDLITSTLALDVKKMLRTIYGIIQLEYIHPVSSLWRWSVELSGMGPLRQPWQSICASSPIGKIRFAHVA